jgi:hypothetical protein
MTQHLSKLIIFLVVFIFTAIPIFAFAVSGAGVIGNPTSQLQSGGGPGGGGGDYTPITPGYTQIFGTGGGLNGMLEGLFRISVMLTIVLSVVMMIAGGIQYMGSESIFAKGEGKQRIFAAISGLLIALVSILIISTILPYGNGGTFDIDIFGDQ